MWIQNVALSDIKKGFHINPGDNAMLIQIVDCGMEFPESLYKFKHVAQFQFLDLEKDDYCIEDEMKITDAQAKSLVLLLKQAYANHMNVIVHCVAGVCRSGAVCEVGVMMGFEDTEAFRSPNLLVKHKMMRYLGWSYDESESHTINGIELASGLIVPKNYEGDI
jgi:protein tyrosine phosphatase